MPLTLSRISRYASSTDSAPQSPPQQRCSGYLATVAAKLSRAFWPSQQPSALSRGSAVPSPGLACQTLLAGHPARGKQLFAPIEAQLDGVAGRERGAFVDCARARYDFFQLDGFRLRRWVGQLVAVPAAQRAGFTRLVNALQRYPYHHAEAIIGFLVPVAAADRLAMAGMLCQLPCRRQAVRLASCLLETDLDQQDMLPAMYIAVQVSKLADDAEEISAMPGFFRAVTDDITRASVQAGLDRLGQHFPGQLHGSCVCQVVQAVGQMDDASYRTWREEFDLLAHDLPSQERNRWLETLVSNLVDADASLAKINQILHDLSRRASKSTPAIEHCSIQHC